MNQKVKSTMQELEERQREYDYQEQLSEKRREKEYCEKLTYMEGIARIVKQYKLTVLEYDGIKIVREATADYPDAAPPDKHDKLVDDPVSAKEEQELQEYMHTDH